MNSLSYPSSTLRLSLPKFELTVQSSFVGVFKNLGIKKAFSGTADFTNIYNPSKLYISNIIHKIYLKVDEKGTEAATVTTVMCWSLPSRETFIDMVVDKPFIFAIQDKKIPDKFLFIGKISDI